MGEKRILQKIEAALRRLRKIGNFMRGTLRERYITCGKAQCRCKQPDEPPHGPYTYIDMTRTDGRHVSIMIPGQYAEEAKRLVDNFDTLWENIERVTELNLERFTAVKFKQSNRLKEPRRKKKSR